MTIRDFGWVLIWVLLTFTILVFLNNGKVVP